MTMCFTLRATVKVTTHCSVTDVTQSRRPREVLLPPWLILCITPQRIDLCMLLRPPLASGCTLGIQHSTVKEEGTDVRRELIRKQVTGGNRTDNQGRREKNRDEVNTTTRKPTSKVKQKTAATFRWRLSLIHPALYQLLALVVLLHTLWAPYYPLSIIQTAQPA